LTGGVYTKGQSGEIRVHGGGLDTWPSGMVEDRSLTCGGIWVEVRSCRKKENRSVEYGLPPEVKEIKAPRGNLRGHFSRTHRVGVGGFCFCFGFLLVVGFFWLCVVFVFMFFVFLVLGFFFVCWLGFFLVFGFGFVVSGGGSVGMVLERLGVCCCLVFCCCCWVCWFFLVECVFFDLGLCGFWVVGFCLLGLCVCGWGFGFLWFVVGGLYVVGVCLFFGMFSGVVLCLLLCGVLFWFFGVVGCLGVVSFCF